MELDHATIKNLAAEKGVDKIEDDAIEELGQLLELYAGFISEEAVGQAEEHQRAAVTKEDVQKALE